MSIIFPHYTQLDAMDCGPTSLRMIAKHYGRNYSLQSLREKMFITREGVSMQGIADAAESIGFHTLGGKVSFKMLKENAPLPCILHWNQNHFIVLFNVKKDKYYVSDPASTNMVISEDEFKQCWISTKTDGQDMGFVLLLEPGPDFNNIEDEKETHSLGLSFFFRYITPYKKQLIQLFIGIIAVSLLQLITPFLTQSMVDMGIRDSNLSFITIILIAQLIIFFAGFSINIIRDWILLHVNTRILISLISSFLVKLMRLPIRFFDTKMIGDIMQRIGDHERIKSFMTGTSISTLFSFFNFITFSFVLGYFNLTILGLFLLGNGLYVAWVLAFMKYRRALDAKRFIQSSNEQSTLLQLITGMQEIKLNNCETEKRWQWERIQVKLFKINVKSLAIEQYQQLGSAFFSQTTNILILFLAAKTVVSGNMTLGMMMSLIYIIGQLMSPIEQFVSFTRSFQDARISLERLNEIHQNKDEAQISETKQTVLPSSGTINVENLSFSYGGADRDYVLDNICLKIPEKKITAIVGSSGSGKTTLIKLILGFYEPNKGSIKIGHTPLQNINPQVWRSHAGSVMQDGFIFSDTIARNIALGIDTIDKQRLMHAVTVANIRDFIDSLPLGYNTRIGMEGCGLSQGQRQRILIARAVYKNPEYIFLDEATNALDAKNEKEIMRYLNEFYIGKTVVIIAHRLSTVKNADNIIVLDNGKIAEEGTHKELTAKQGIYYQLVKDQLELGS